MALEDLYGKILARAIDVIRKETSLPALINHQTTGDRALLDLEPTPSLSVAPDSRIRIALSDLFPPF